MAFSINRIVPRYFQVKEHLKRQILDGTLSGKLPSERDLARQYGLAPMTVRRAVSELVEEGFLFREIGKGTFVCGPGSPVRRTYNTAFVLSSVVTDGALNPYFSVILQGVQAECAARGYSVIYCTRIEEVLPLNETGPAGRSGRKVDGIVAAAVSSAEEPIVARASRFIPVVTLDCRVEGVASVLPDNVGGAQLATTYLLNLGHKRIAHLAGALESAVGRQRLEGYKSALQKAGIICEPELICEAGFSFERGYSAVDVLLSAGKPFTAVFCANDAVALGAMKRLKERGLRVPSDVSVVGFDDIEMAKQSEPPLTTISVDKRGISKAAVEYLMRVIEQPSHQRAAEEIVVACRLVERQSCSPPA